MIYPPIFSPRLSISILYIVFSFSLEKIYSKHKQMHKTIKNHKKCTQTQRRIKKTHKLMKLEAMIYKQKIKK